MGIGAFFKKAVMAGALAAALGAAAAEAAPVCLRTLGTACRDPQAFAEGGIVSMKFLPGSFQRQGAQAAWTLLGFMAGDPSQQDPVRITAVYDGVVTGENQMLSIQNDICAKVREGGVACTRDYLEGNWYTYALNGGQRAFSVELHTTELADLYAQGEFTTRRAACRKGDGAAAKEVEVVCKGTYNTSLRLFYLINDSHLSFANVSCAEGQSAAATSATAALPACDATGAYPASQWLPFGQQTAKLKWVNTARLFLPESQIPLYYKGWNP